MHSQIPRVSVFGAAHIDVEMRLLGSWHEAASNPVSRFERIGGVACNVATQLATCCNTHLYTVLGHDSQGRQIHRELTARGVRVNSFATGHRTGTYIAVLETDGELRAGLADTAAIEAVEGHHLQQFEHQDGIDLQQHFQQQQAVCFDCNCSESLIAGICAAVQAIRQPLPATATRPIFAALGVSPAKIGKLRAHAQQIDILFANRAELTTLARCDNTASPETLLDKLAQAGFHQIVATDGANDTMVLSAGTITRLPVPPVTLPAGSRNYSVNGAGDALAAATLAAVMQQTSLVMAVRDAGFDAACRQMLSQTETT